MDRAELRAEPLRAATPAHTDGLRQARLASAAQDRGDRWSGGDMVPEPPSTFVAGLHDVRIPVSDPWASRDWYVALLGCTAVLDLEEESGVVGVVLRHQSGLTIGLHRDRVRAVALRGFSVLGLTVEGPERLSKLTVALDHLGFGHLPPARGHLGEYVDVPDPDGLLVRFHTGWTPDAEEA
ncbi:MAG TPA: VOC family protein [Acidimicrobiales bacterium]|nr:VOC family protein [Acidimicrobiales bacterium]